MGIALNASFFGSCDANIIAHCIVSGNVSYGINLAGGNGQCDGNVIANCMINRNYGYGIVLDAADGNRVEGNHISGQTGLFSYGIYCNTTTNNMIFRNTCVGQAYNYTIPATDTYGPIVTNSGALAPTGAAANAWANFSR